MKLGGSWGDEVETESCCKSWRCCVEAKETVVVEEGLRGKERSGCGWGSQGQGLRHEENDIFEIVLISVNAKHENCQVLNSSRLSCEKWRYFEVMEMDSFSFLVSVLIKPNP